MCTICIDYRRGAISKQEALLNLAEMIAVAAEEDTKMFNHLEEVEEMLLEEGLFNDHRETD